MAIPALGERPQLPPDLLIVQDAFDFLSLSRLPGFGGPGAIPLAEILAYVSAFPVSMPDADFIELIRLIDSKHLHHLTTTAKDGHSQDTRSRH